MRRALRSKRTVSYKSTSSEQNTRFEDERSYHSSEKGETLQDYSKNLDQSFIPNIIPCRQEQKQVIHSFLKNCLMAKINSKVLYISGVPGVGKTITTNEVLSNFKKNHKKVTMNYINALQLFRAVDIYEAIYKKLPNIQKNTKLKKSLVLKQLSKKIQLLSTYQVFVIDEVDYLITRDQSILYNLFEWSYNYPFILIIIANSMNLKQKLSNKVASRMGDNRLIFKPYNQKQIAQIIQSRIKQAKYFTKDAIMYACKKMCTFTSDIRKILYVLRRAQSQRSENKVTIQQIIKIWKQVSGGGQEWQQAIPEFFKILLEVIKQRGGKTDSYQIYQILRPRYHYTNLELMSGLKQLENLGIVKLQSIIKNGLRCDSILLIKL